MPLSRRIRYPPTSERPVAVTQRSSARLSPLAVPCCSSPGHRRSGLAVGEQVMGHEPRPAVDDLRGGLRRGGHDKTADRYGVKPVRVTGGTSGTSPGPRAPGDTTLAVARHLRLAAERERRDLVANSARRTDDGIPTLG